MTGSHYERYAVVTGGADGIGWAVARALRAAGRPVVLADLDGDRAQTRCAGDAGLAAIALDVSDGTAVADAFARLLHERGPLGLLVNNAGIRHQGPLASVADDEWARVIGTNLGGAFHCLKAAGGQMLDAGGGVVVNMVSIAAARGMEERAPYAAAKAGLVSLTQSAAVEWGRRGVRVNAVGPSYVETAMMREAFDRGLVDEATVVERIPLGRVASADEVAAATCFLASEQASYLNGHVLWVDGGFLANHGIPPARRS